MRDPQSLHRVIRDERGPTADAGVNAHRAGLDAASEQRYDAFTMMSSSSVGSMSLEDLGYVMTNLAPKHTGLPFVVWISPRMQARHNARIRVSRNRKVESLSQLIAVAIHPEIRVIGKNSFSVEEL